MNPMPSGATKISHVPALPLVKAPASTISSAELDPTPKISSLPPFQVSAPEMW